MKFYVICSKTTLALFYCLLLFLVVIGTFGVVSTDYGINAEFEEHRKSYLSLLGIDEISSPVDCEEITIPFEFKGFYSDYNNIQKSANYDLSCYKGQAAKLYTYNYGDYFIHLILIKGRIVGGDFTQKIHNGKILPLNTESVNEVNKT